MSILCNSRLINKSRDFRAGHVVYEPYTNDTRTRCIYIVYIMFRMYYGFICPRARGNRGVCNHIEQVYIIGIPRDDRPIYIYIIIQLLQCTECVCDVTISSHKSYRRRRIKTAVFIYFAPIVLKKKLKFTRVRRTLAVGPASYPGACRGRCGERKSAANGRRYILSCRILQYIL